ncbi:hypothetical protein [Streptomyces xanthochromogenes]|uniref:hypothetical protein n=1 Tax=Streptomyces xanthochromogenes TaxID=67384 RepID=UPI001677E422|nr:hypothetical protein [Streptomyces xanthochromogenes]
MASKSRTGDRNEGLGTPLVVRGDVAVYPPVHKGSVLTVPVSIVNTGAERAFYRADVHVTGPDGFDVVLHIDTPVVGVYPGASWPTELSTAVAGKSVPAHPTVTVDNYGRREYRD